MTTKPKVPDIVNVVRNAREQDIVRRLDELGAETAALKQMLRVVRAREQARPVRTEGRSNA